MEQSVVGRQVISRNCRALPDIAWSPCSYVEHRGSTVLLHQVNSRKIYHCLPLNRRATNGLRFLSPHWLLFMFIVNHSLNMTAWVHNVLILLIVAVQVSVVSIIILNHFLILLRCKIRVFIMMHIYTAHFTFSTYFYFKSILNLIVFQFCWCENPKLWLSRVVCSSIHL